MEAKKHLAASTNERDRDFWSNKCDKLESDTTYTRGIVKQFFAFRDLIVALPGYTNQIGEDLGLVGNTITALSPDTVSPELKTGLRQVIG